MARTLEIEVKSDHLEKLTTAIPENALSELIWNSLDADATSIIINSYQNELGFLEKMEIIDNGSGISYKDAESIFQCLGGSPKKNQKFSPKNRILHGKEGKGRLKAFSLGSLIHFESSYRYNGTIRKFRIKMDRDDLKHLELEDEAIVHSENYTGTGMKVTIFNICLNMKSLLTPRKRELLEQKFAVYYSNYKNFQITIDNENLNLENAIIDKFVEDFILYDENNNQIHFQVQILEWIFNCDKKLYLCNKSGIAYDEQSLRIRSHYNITVYLCSDYINSLQQDNILELGETNEILQDAVSKAREIVKNVIRDKMHNDAKGFIEQLKSDKIYPYESDPIGHIEVAERQIFDIVALQLKDYLPTFSEQDKKNRRLTLRLIKEALENDKSNIDLILNEVLSLPDEKKIELNEILKKTSLNVIIDTMKEIQDRLKILYELEVILFDKEERKKVLERKHLHKILINETWVFGDDYTYGADDITLKNVLKEYLKYLGRDDFAEIVQSGNNSQIKDDIPDVCLWKQYNRGVAGHFENMIVELKRPSKIVTLTEIDQVTRYASEVAEDHRFPKEKTRWKFILLATELNKEAERKCNQKDRKYGHIDCFENVDVFVVKWGNLLNEAKARHQYLKEKLNYNISEEDEGIKILRKRYSQYLPEVSAEE